MEEKIFRIIRSQQELVFSHAFPPLYKTMRTRLDEDNFYVITGQNLELTTLKENSLLAIESLWPSSQYNTTMDFSNFQQNDLLILRTKIDMTDFIPACIPDLQQDANAAGQVPKKCWFIGLNGYGGAFQVPATMMGDSEEQFRKNNLKFVTRIFETLKSAMIISF